MLLVIVVALLGLILLYKNEITYKNFMILEDAIHSYNLSVLYTNNLSFDKGDLLPYEESFIKSYYVALFNMFDWGYDNLVHTDTYEKIKPYIK